MNLRLRSLHVHPLKSGAVRDVQRVDVTGRGLSDDRSWMVVDATGQMVTARRDHRLLHVQADTAATDASVAVPLRLRGPGLPDLGVPVPAGSPTPVTLHGEELAGVDAGDEAAAWLRTALGRDDVRLVWCDDPDRRALDPAYTSPEEHTAYADSYPVTVATTASMAQLNDWIAEGAVERGEELPDPLPVARFRPNLVVDGGTAFDEDSWRRVRVGEVSFRVTKACSRCVLTTVDPVTLARGKEPIRTLARHRNVGGKTLFAVNLVPETTGTLHVGDDVVVERG
ncbi:MAG: MOSC domain-containing protein [Nocardioides sp.]|uniref:MOSC domain-containing protein n=1 Tax=Nocardioides sp. TaxID=35761 RepID=UPI003EFF2D3E